MPSPIYDRRAREARKLIDGGQSLSAAARMVGISRVTLKSYIDNGIGALENKTQPLCEYNVDRSREEVISSAKKLREIRFSFHRISRIVGVSPKIIYDLRDKGVFREIEEEYKKQCKREGHWIHK